MTEGEKSLRILRVTTEYDGEEDRLRLAVLLSAGGREEREKAVLWITRRIAERLIAALLERVRTIEPEAPLPEAQAKQVRQAGHVYAQLQARLMKKPSSPVRPAEATWQALVREIQLRVSPEGRLALVYRCPEREAVTQYMNQTQLRQWLQLLHGLFARAGWNQSIWPDWIGKPERPAAG